MEENRIEELTEQTAAEPEPAESEEKNEPCSELAAALIEARVKLALLLCGAAKEKLADAAKLALGMVAAGMEPEEAAEQTIKEYPHLKLTAREVPVFAADTSGSSDGFAAIRSIFAKRG